MEVREIAESEMTAELDRQILVIQNRAFNNTGEFNTQRWWHTPSRPDDRWFLAFDGPRLIGNVRLVHRTIHTTGGPRSVGGVANVCSDPASRGQGAATAAMQAAQAHIARNTDFGLLWCGEKVHSFYGRLGWADITDPMTMLHPDGHHGLDVPRADHYMMIYPGRCRLDQWPAGPFDLNGQDW